MKFDAQQIPEVVHGQADVQERGHWYNDDGERRINNVHANGHAFEHGGDE